MDRVLSALARVDVWILIATVVGSTAAVAAAVIGYLTLTSGGLRPAGLAT